MTFTCDSKIQIDF